MKSFRTPDRRKALADIFRSLPVGSTAGVLPGPSGSADVILSGARDLQLGGEADRRFSASRAIRFTTMAAVLLGALASANAADGQTARQSWTSDSRDFAEGDAITVLIDEYTLAAANRGNFASDRRFRDLELGADQSVSASIPGVAAAVSSANQNESRQRDEATRQNRFQGEMTVRVVGIETGGMLRVEGTKTLNIDGAVEELTLSGLVRAQDVGDLNMVESWRISDTEIVYSTRGNGPKGGIFGRILGMLWP